MTCYASCVGAAACVLGCCSLKTLVRMHRRCRCRCHSRWSRHWFRCVSSRSLSVWVGAGAFSIAYSLVVVLVCIGMLSGGGCGTAQCVLCVQFCVCVRFACCVCAGLGSMSAYMSVCCLWSVRILFCALFLCAVSAGMCVFVCFH